MRRKINPEEKYLEYHGAAEGSGHKKMSKMEIRMDINKAAVNTIEGNRIDDIIGEILKIESAAIGILSDTEKEKEEYARMVEQRRKEFDEQLESETSEKLAKLNGQLKSEKEEEMSAMRSDILSQTSRMEAAYEANHEKWVRDIVESIIKE